MNSPLFLLLLAGSSLLATACSVEDQRSAAPAPASDTATASGAGSVTGMPDGQPLAVVDAYAHIRGRLDGGHELALELADHAGLCTAPSVKYVGGRSLLFSVRMPEAEIGVGTLSFDRSDRFAALLEETWGDDCSGRWTNAEGESGTVTVTEVTEAHVTGTFSVIMVDNKSGDRKQVEGRFDAARCDAFATNDATVVCKQR